MAFRVPLSRDENRSVLPDGVYEAVIEEVDDTRVGQGSGIPYLNLTLSIRKNGRPVGGTVWDIVSMSEKAAFRLAAFLDAIGAPEEGDVSSQWFKGKRGWVELKTDTYTNKDGKTVVKNVVDRWLEPDLAEEMLIRQAADSEGQAMSLDDGETAPAPRRGRGRPAAQPEVAEMEEEEMPL